MKIPDEYKEKIGKPQRIARVLELDGREVVVRMQRPFEEPPDDVDEMSFRVDGEGNFYDTEDWRRYGTCLIVETWSEATECVVSDAIIKSESQTDEEFNFGVRYILNNGTDDEIIEVIKSKRLDRLFKYSCFQLKKDSFVEPTVKEK